MPADLPLWYAGLVLAMAIATGATASVVGFGIGSLLTPLMAALFGTELAIAAIALPHLAGGLLRGWRLRASVDRQVLVSSCRKRCVLRAMRAARSLGSASASSSELVCSEFVPPRTAASACSAVRTTLL